MEAETRRWSEEGDACMMLLGRYYTGGRSLVKWGSGESLLPCW